MTIYEIVMTTGVSLFTDKRPTVKPVVELEVVRERHASQAAKLIARGEAKTAVLNGHKVVYILEHDVE